MASIMTASKRLALSYVFDWIIIIAIAAAGAGLSQRSPNMRPFSLADPEISFPYAHEKVTTAVLAVVCLVVPAAVILVVCLVSVPGPTVDKRTPFALKLRRKLWEWHVSWLGLAMSLAIAFFLTNAVKNLMGKPRPDLLARCNPAIDDLQKYIVGGFGSRVPDGTVLVSADICQTRGNLLDEGFRSFPSGHSSFSFAGLTYLTLFLASKFAIAVPFLAPRAFTADTSSITGAFPHHTQHRSGSPVESTNPASSFSAKDAPANNATLSAPTAIPLRNQAAAPPAYLLVVAFIPLAAAIYISTTRYSDFRHHGFDILFGSLMGILIAWFSFRWYHLPVSQGAGWSWGPRSRERAWAVGLGVHGYVGREGWSSAKASGTRDLEAANGNTVSPTHAGAAVGAERRQEPGEPSGPTTV